MAITDLRRIIAEGMPEVWLAHFNLLSPERVHRTFDAQLAGHGHQSPRLPLQSLQRDALFTRLQFNA